jgi:hypothetical protein
MTRSHLATISLASFALIVVATAFTVAAQSSHGVLHGNALQWGPAPPALPPGAQLSVLDGNPGAKGPVTMRLKLPANYDIPPHWHSMDERLTLISGALRVGMGDTIDRAHSDTLAPGDFVSLPAKMHHYAWTATPTIVQIDLEGPFDIFYVHPADDPQTKKTSTR